MEGNNIINRKAQAKNAEVHDGTIVRTQSSTLASHSDPFKEPTPTSSTTAITAAIVSPALLTTLLLIFGGCCSNVYTLESILSISPATGHLVTFLQFLLTSIFTLPSQITTKNLTSFIPGLRTRQIPLRKWIFYTLMFVTINVLNNAAFNYKISIPLHIILRSAGPVTSMLVGYFGAGRRYPPRKILAVTLLFCGVVMAALSDAWNKTPKPKSIETTSTSSSPSGPSGTSNTGIPVSALTEQGPGFILLALALLLSAALGLYSDRLYDQHGRSASLTSENLFYSHTLALPMFLLQHDKLTGQYTTLLATSVHNTLLRDTGRSTSPSPTSVVVSSIESLLPSIHTVPSLLLLANALTQIVCITGVHRLSTQTTSLTVSVVLNIRKLASLILSILVFGNQLSTGVVAGAVLVFVGGGIYSWPGAAKGGAGGKGGKDKAKPQMGKESERKNDVSPATYDSTARSKSEAKKVL